MAVVVSLIVGCGVVIVSMFVAVAVAVAMVVACLRTLAMGSTASSVFFSSVHFDCCGGVRKYAVMHPELQRVLRPSSVEQKNLHFNTLQKV